MRQGLAAEAWFSLLPFHATPLLISTKVSKNFFIKQIDYATQDKDQVILWEIKSYQKSEQLALDRALGMADRFKWLRTKAFLSNILGLKVKVKLALIRVEDNFHLEKNYNLY